MKKNYFYVSNLGIGDLILFCADVLSKIPKNEELIIKFDDLSLIKYKNSSHNYKNLCLQLIRYLLSDYVISMSEEDRNKFNLWYPGPRIYEEINCNEEINDHFNKKFHTNILKKYSDSLVVVTKVRDLDISLFESLSKTFYETLNRLNSNIILIGEKKIHINEEYEQLKRLGGQPFYSIYSDLIENLDNIKVTDLTANEYNTDNNSLSDFLEKTNVIYNSKKTIIFGGGGFFCASYFFSNFISFTYKKRALEFNKNKNKKIFYDADDFLKCLNDV